MITTQHILRPGPVPRDFLSNLLIDGKKAANGRGFAALIVEVTPPLAAHLLDNLYDRQRDNSASRVEMYTDDMLSDRWVAFGDAIHVDSAGRLINGQRRCRAIVASKKSLVVLLVVCFDERAYAALDGGQERTTKDQYLALTGRSIGSSHLSAALFEMDDFKRVKRSAVAASQAVAKYDRMRFLSELVGWRSPNVAQYAGRVAGALRCSRLDAQAAPAFFEAVFEYRSEIDGKPVPVIQDLWAAWQEIHEEDAPRWGHPKKLYEAHYAMAAFIHYLKSPRKSPERGRKRHGLIRPGKTFEPLILRSGEIA